MFGESNDEEKTGKSKGLAILLAKKVTSKKPMEKEEDTEGVESEGSMSDHMVEDIFSAVKEGNKDLFKSALDAYVEMKLSERD